jgi:hypothetical protein
VWDSSGGFVFLRDWFCVGRAVAVLCFSEIGFVWEEQWRFCFSEIGSVWDSSGGFVSERLVLCGKSSGGFVFLRDCLYRISVAGLCF